jgi:very-short-patch-repair endonuclease
MNKPRHYRGGFQFAGSTGRVRELRKKQTSAEELLWSRLRNRQLLNFKFRRQHQFAKYIADFYCRDAQLVIECDGSAHDPNEQWQHDRDRDAYMISQGLRVLRFSNDRVLDNVESVLDEISRYLVSRNVREASGELQK